MRSLRTLGLAALAATGLAAASAEPNTLTGAEKQEGWKLLWDGKTPAGWRGLLLESFPAKGWQIKDGELSVLNKAESADRGGDIVTAALYTNFEFRFEFRLTEGANSGVKYFVFPDFVKAQKSAIACEYQVLDDDKHPDAKLGAPGTRTIGALYDAIAPAKDKPVKPIGAWNEGRIVVRGARVEHWLNGAKVVAYDRTSAEFKAAAARSKFAKFPDWGTWPYGHLLLQDHNDHVSYRSLKVRALPAE